MNTLADTLSYVMTALQEWKSCSAVRVIETHSFSAYRFAFKVRAVLNSGATLQVRIYCNGSHIDYSYQLLRDGKPLLRWDNKEHFQEIATHPHHFHSYTGEVEMSSLTGDIAHDLAIVLEILEHDQQFQIWNADETARADLSG